MEISMAFRHILLNVGLILMIIILFTEKFAKSDTERYKNVLDSYAPVIIPLHYNVKLNFEVSKNIFFGECNIKIQIKGITKNITIMTSRIFSIVSVSLFDDIHNKIIRIPNFSFINKPLNKTYIFLDFIKSSMLFLPLGTYILQMIYVQTILDGGDYFESFYTDKEELLRNKGIKLIKAEELFPCWDEPAFKSTFKIIILHHKNYTFLSSMSIRKQFEDVNDMMWTYIDESYSISIQRLTIVMIEIIKFSYFSTSDKNVKFWYRMEAVEQMQFAKDIVKDVLYRLEQKSITNISKIDYVVIKNFQYSDVRPQGFVLLREEDVIYNNTIDHNVRKIEVANLIARETIFCWYSDVLLWSKEGFITFLAADILNQAQYRTMDLFVVQTQQESLRFDTLPVDSYPLYTANIAAVNSFQSSFQYIKSFITWRMLYHLVSEDVFWTGIRTYIMQYNQSNIYIDQLWNIIQSVFDNRNGSNLQQNKYNIYLNITDIMNIWIFTEQKYSHLFVERNYLKALTIFTSINSTLDEKVTFLTLVTYTTKSNDYNSFLFDWKRPWFVKKKFDIIDWIIVNLEQIGYYRVNYDLDNWKNLMHYLSSVNYSSIHVLNRAQIIDDAFYFLMQRNLSFNLFWNITSFLFHDTDYIAWYPMIKAVEYMTCIWPVQNNDNIKMKIMEVFFHLLHNIGYNDKVHESDFTQNLREEAVKWLCVLGDPECRRIAANKLREVLESSVQDKPLKWREWIYCKGLMSANGSIWWKVLSKSMDTFDNTFSKYLTCSTNINIIRIFVTQILQNMVQLNQLDKNRVNIFLLIIVKHAKNQAVLEYIYDVFKYSIKEVYRIAILIVIITHKHDVDQLQEVSKFVQSYVTSDIRLIDAVKQK
nr:PREDICTED: thyrotropin-releasing hormone-degrading ectoenzyme-like isoform X1 [Linepithema humile]